MIGPTVISITGDGIEFFTFLDRREAHLGDETTYRWTLEMMRECDE